MADDVLVLHSGGADKAKWVEAADRWNLVAADDGHIFAQVGKGVLRFPRELVEERLRQRYGSVLPDKAWEDET